MKGKVVSGLSESQNSLSLPLSLSLDSSKFCCSRLSPCRAS